MGNKSRADKSRPKPTTATDPSDKTAGAPCEGDHDQIREFPNRISHKFWLRQYSWLQQQQQQQHQPDEQPPPTLSASAAADQEHLHRRQTKRLLTRWGNLIRNNFGSSSANVVEPAAGSRWSASARNLIRLEDDDDDDEAGDSSRPAGARSAPPPSQPSTSRAARQAHVVSVNVVPDSQQQHQASPVNPSALGKQTRRLKANGKPKQATNKKANYSFCGWQAQNEEENSNEDEENKNKDNRTRDKSGKSSADTGSRSQRRQQQQQKDRLSSPNKSPSGRLGGWLLKSVSSSTSTLTTIVVCDPQQQQQQVRADQVWQQQQPEAEATSSNLSPRRASPYRRLARALMISSGGGGLNQDESSEPANRKAERCQSSKGSSLFTSLFVSPRSTRRDPGAADRNKKRQEDEDEGEEVGDEEEEENMIKKAKDVCNFKIRRMEGAEQEEHVQSGEQGERIRLQRTKLDSANDNKSRCFKSTTTATTRRRDSRNDCEPGDGADGKRREKDANLNWADVVVVPTETTTTTESDNNGQREEGKLIESSYQASSVETNARGAERRKRGDEEGGEPRASIGNNSHGQPELGESSSELFCSAGALGAELVNGQTETKKISTKRTRRTTRRREQLDGKIAADAGESAADESEVDDDEENENYANESGEPEDCGKRTSGATSGTISASQLRSEGTQVTNRANLGDETEAAEEINFSSALNGAPDTTPTQTTTTLLQNGKTRNEPSRVEANQSNGELRQFSDNNNNHAGGKHYLSGKAEPEETMACGAGVIHDDDATQPSGRRSSPPSSSSSPLHHNNDQSNANHNQLERNLMPLIQPSACSSASPTFNDYFEHSQKAQLEQHASVGSVSFVLNSGGGGGLTDDQLDDERPTSQPASMLTTQQPQIARSHQRDSSSSHLSSNKNNKHSLTTSMSGGGGPASGGHSSIGGGGGFVGLKSNFKKLVKRQQSVDSYRMTRDLKNKLKRQQEAPNKHQSNEAIKTKGVGDESEHAADRAAGRKYSMRLLDSVANFNPTGGVVKWKQQQQRDSQDVVEPVLKICVDPYAEPGSFGLPTSTPTTSPPTTTDRPTTDKQRASKNTSATGKQVRVSPTPPNTLSLMPSASNLLRGSGFSGCITPTYPTHHLPSPKYVSPATFLAMEKKYSNASTISSSFGGDSAAANSNNNAAAKAAGRSPDPANETNGHQVATTANQSDTESSMGAGSVTPSRLSCGAASSNRPSVQLSHHSVAGVASDRPVTPISNGHGGAGGGEGSASEQLAASIARANEEAVAALRRANLAEHIYDNKCGLGEDMKFLASLPELCDITFLVGETREPVCAVKSVLAARSRVFHKILFGNRTARSSRFIRQQAQYQHQMTNDGTTNMTSESLIPTGKAAGDSSEQQQRQDSIDNSGRSPDLRRGSSPRQAVQVARNWVNAVKSSSPVSRSTSPNQLQQQQQQQQQQWSVTSDASGYNNSRAVGDSTSPASAATTAGNRSGRVSAASNGRDSCVSQTSQGSQQPLIIGPGQTATPAKRTKKGAISRSGATGGSANVDQQHHHHGGASRLRSMFMNKRPSDPAIKQQNNQTIANQNYLDKMSSSQMSTTMIIEEFEPDVFRQLIEYIHTGCVLLQARTLLGLLNAADYYGLEQLRKACLRFVSCCITVDTVCSLLSTAERYIQYKCTKSIVQKVLEFVDSHANEIFKLNAFGLLPEHVVRLILARDGLQADEFVKYNGVYTWCEHYCRSYELTNIADVMKNFLDLIQLYKIPTNLLLSEIYPTHVIPDNLFLSALAYQANPENFEPQQARPRRMTLPNPTVYNKDFDDPASAESPTEQLDAEFNGISSRSSISSSKTKSIRRRDSSMTNATDQLAGRRDSTASGARKPTGAQLTFRQSSASGHQSIIASAKNQSTTPTKSRKGSIAQASINGVMRLSHKLSIRKRHSSNMGSEEARRRGSTATGSSWIGGSSGSGRHGKHKKTASISKQSSIATCGSGISHHHHRQPGLEHRVDPLQVGQQILNAFLVEQRQRELEEKERQRRERQERRAAEEELKQQGGGGDSSPLIAINSEQQQQQPHAKQPVAKTPSGNRKSVRDFKHISRRLFMRHSSSKTLQQQQSTSSRTSESNVKSGTSSTEVTPTMSSTGERRRNLLKIKRSETVVETSQSSPHHGATGASPKHQQAKLSHQMSSNIK